MNRRRAWCCEVTSAERAGQRQCDEDGVRRLIGRLRALGNAQHGAARTRIGRDLGLARTRSLADAGGCRRGAGSTPP
jgi:hypothetical protein